MDSRVIYFNQFDSDVFFGLTFYIGHDKLDLQQYAEDKYNLFIDGNRFYDLMTQEKIERQSFIKQKEREYQKRKKMEDDYYKRALKYNGNDYYEGKEKTLFNNNDRNKVNANININNNNKYTYEQYKQKRSKTMNNYNNYPNNNYNYPPNNNYIYNNYNYPPNNNYNYPPNNNYINNNYNYPPNNNYNQNRQNINNYGQNQNNNYNNKYDPYYEKEEEPKNNNNYQEEEANNPYPSFSQYLNTENNAGYNDNRLNLNNNNNNNYYYDNDRNNNNKNNNLMNQIEEVFTNEKNQNQNFNKRSTVDLPTYSEILAPQNNNQNQPKKSQNKINVNKKNNTESDNLINYIGNLNKKGNNNVTNSIKPLPEDTNNNNGYNFGFEDDENDYKVNENNQIELNIYNHNQIDKERNKKKMFVNKSSFKNPLKEEDYDMENPYNNY